MQIKKVPDAGKPEESCFVHGLACRKNLTHRRMRKHISNPRILLLASRLESHRTQTRLASFDNLTADQVRPFAQLCHKILVLICFSMRVTRSACTYRMPGMMHCHMMTIA